LHDYKPKSIQIDEQTFWKTTKPYTSDKKSISKKKATDDDPTT
jgi:hypothetical protein